MCSYVNALKLAHFSYLKRKRGKPVKRRNRPNRTLPRCTEEMRSSPTALLLDKTETHTEKMKTVHREQKKMLRHRDTNTDTHTLDIARLETATVVLRQRRALPRKQHSRTHARSALCPQMTKKTEEKSTMVTKATAPRPLVHGTRCQITQRYTAEDQLTKLYFSMLYKTLHE